MGNIGTTSQISKIRLDEQVGDPSAPAVGYWVLYVKATGLFIEDALGNVYGPFAIAGILGDHDHQGAANDGGKLTGPIIDTFMDVEFSSSFAPALPAANILRIYSRYDGPTLKLYYERSDGTEVEMSGGLHAATHENGGIDELNVGGLSGVLADDQNPVAHASDHENGGGDEISVAGLSGQLADIQKHSFAFCFALPGDLEVKTYEARFPVPWAGTITNVVATVNTAPTGASLIIDVLLGGATIYGITPANKPTIAAGDTEDLGTNTPDTTALSQNDILTVQVEQVGSTIPGADCIVQIRGNRT